MNNTVLLITPIIDIHLHFHKGTEDISNISSTHVVLEYFLLQIFTKLNLLKLIFLSVLVALSTFLGELNYC